MADSPDEILKRGFDGFKGTTLEARVAELADREEIRELAARYALTLAHRRSATDLFTEDGVYAIRTRGMKAEDIQGRAQFDATYAKLHSGPRRNLPTVHNQVTTVAEDEAVGFCWGEVRAVHEGVDIGLRSGDWEDGLRRDGGRWKFATRKALMQANDRTRPTDNPLRAKEDKGV